MTTSQTSPTPATITFDDVDLIDVHSTHVVKRDAGNTLGAACLTASDDRYVPPVPAGTVRCNYAVAN
jgi:hypothetical protein